MNAPRIELEPARFAMTGGGLSIYGLRDEFTAERFDGSMDAPAFIPSGSVKNDTGMLKVATTPRPGAFA